MILFPLLMSFRAPRCEGTTTVLINAKAGQQANPFTQGGDATANKITNELAFLRARGLAHEVAESLLTHPYLDTLHRTVLPILLAQASEDSHKVQRNVDLITDRIQGAVSFAPEKESDIIRIVASSPDPREAALLANTYADTYRNEAMHSSRSQTSSAREFLEGRLAEQRGQLRQAEEQMRHFMETNGVVSMDEESSRLIQEISQLEGTRDGLRIEIQGLERRVNTLTSELPQQESSVANSLGQANNSYITMLSQRLAELEVQRDVLMARNDPAVISQSSNQEKLKELNDRIRQLRENLRVRTNELIWGARETGTVGEQADPLNFIRTLRQQLLDAKIQLETQQSRKNALDAIISGYEGRFSKIPQKRLEFARIQREHESTEKVFKLVEEKYNETAITEKSEFGYVTIVDWATPAGSKPRSSVVLYAMIGFVLGLGLALGFVFLREASDVRVRTPEQLHEAGYPTLTEIASMDNDLRTLNFDGFVPKEADAFAPIVKIGFHPMSFAAESYRRMRTGLMRQKLDRNVTSIMITSANPGEGKSTTLLNLAISLAETGQNVLVIDADIRKPVIHSLLGLQRTPGYTDLIAGEDSEATIIHHDVVPHLDVVTCGTAVKHPSRFFGHLQTVDIFSGLRERYAWVLIDVPPVLVVNDAAIISGLVDVTILLADAGATRLEALDRAVNVIQDAGGTFLGTILNRFDPKTAYGAYYGSAKYGHYDGQNSYYSSSDGRPVKK